MEHLETGGQNLDDVFKYVDGEDRLGSEGVMCSAMLCSLLLQ